MRIASYNVENLFNRARVLNEDESEATKPILDAFAALNALIAQRDYSAAEKAAMMELLRVLDLESDDEGRFARIRQNRGDFVRRSRTQGTRIVADGRADWIGWVELLTEAVDELAMRHTAQVIRDVGADVLACVEAESRHALLLFNQSLLADGGPAPYDQVMLIDGNDLRGIDVGVMLRPGFALGEMRSHIHDRTAAGRTIFSRDCPEFWVSTPGGGGFWLLVNHFKSKFGGNDPQSQAKRKLQATRVAEIYQGLLDRGEDRVVVAGDLNDTPDSDPLAPLLATDLRDVSTLHGFDGGGFSGTHGFSGPQGGEKLDYILLSPALQGRATAGGVFRKGMWPGTRNPKWPIYPTLTREVHAASDHGAVWVDLAL